MLALLFLAAAAVLSNHPPPLALVLAGGISLLSILALALARYDTAVALGILLLAVVRVEPAPPDLVFAVVIAVAAVTGRFHLRRVPPAVTVLVVSFLALNLLASFEVIDAGRAVMYFAITLYLGIFGLWLAGYVRSVERARLVVGAYIVAATASALVSSLALFVPFPGAALLVDGPRAQGLFKDPNVFGPFLVPAALLLLEEAATPRLFRLRASTKLLLLSVLDRRRRLLVLPRGVAEPRRRLARPVRRCSRCAAAAAAAPWPSSAARWPRAPSSSPRSPSPSSFSFLQERAQLQVYDVQRFGAQLSGIDVALQYPLGVGPGQFERVSTISAHSTYVRALTEEGLLGLAVVLALVLLTLGLAMRAAFTGPRHVRDRLGGPARRLVRAARQQLLRRHAPLAASLARRGADLGGHGVPASTRLRGEVAPRGLPAGDHDDARRLYP